MRERRRLKNPPVVTVMLTVQFEPALSSLTILDIARLFELFEAQYPVFTHVNRAGAMITDPRTITPGGVIEVNALDRLPRVSFSSPDLGRAIFFQDDRVSVNWQRQSPLDEETDYPHFDGLLESLNSELDTLLSWLQTNQFPSVVPSVAEVAYSNAFNLQIGDRRRSMSEIFTFFNNPRQAPMSAFNFAWSELVRPVEYSGTEITGVLNMQTGIGLSPAGSPVALFSLTGNSVVTGDWDSLSEVLTEVHDRVAEIFDAAIQEEILKAELP